MKRLIRCVSEPSTDEFEPLRLSAEGVPTIVFHASPKEIKQFNINDSTQIGLHCGGFLQVLRIHENRRRGHDLDPHLYRITLKPEYNILDVDVDSIGIHKPVQVANDLRYSEGLYKSDDESDLLRQVIVRTSGDADKSKVVTNFILNRGYQAFRYPNVYGLGQSLCILTKDIITMIEDITDINVPPELRQQALQNKG